MSSRILIADDHEMVRRGIRSLLDASHHGVEVLEASDGMEAVEKTIDSKPDLVILDVSMPQLDGFSAAREIKKLSAATPILFLTFQKSEALTEFAQSIGANGYITKGESSDILLSAIDAALAGHGDQRVDCEVSSCSSVVISPHGRSPRGEANPHDSKIRAEKIPELRILLLHTRSGPVDRCLHALKDVQFQIEVDVVRNSEQAVDRLRAKHYDVVIAEYPPAPAEKTPIVDRLRGAGRHTPLIYIGNKISRDAAADLITRGAADCVEMNDLGQLLIAIRRALKENTLRGERARVEKKLQQSEAHYRALKGNLAFGICRCGMDGHFSDVNRTLVSMLGYASKEEMLALNLASGILHDSVRKAQLLGQAGEDGRIEPLETSWPRKDGTPLRVRLSGREVSTDEGKRHGYEIIVEDMTRQHEVEDDLRQQAAKDPLTGLANYRHLQDVLVNEVNRFKRTGREFALLFFDLDKLKVINDRYGHLAGSDALCRLANVLTAGCRSIDTAARFGGDEFAVVLPETGLEAAKSVANRLCANLANDGKWPKLTVSVGVAIYPDNGQTGEALLLAADKALYANKSAS